jgi:hypothetical protein
MQVVRERPFQADEEHELKRLLRTVRTLDPQLRQQWLQLLPHLSAVDRSRLRELLEALNADRAAGSRGPDQG